MNTGGTGGPWFESRWGHHSLPYFSVHNPISRGETLPGRARADTVHPSLEYLRHGMIDNFTRRSPQPQLPATAHARGTVALRVPLRRDLGRHHEAVSLNPLRQRPVAWPREAPGNDAANSNTDGRDALNDLASKVLASLNHPNIVVGPTVSLRHAMGLCANAQAEKPRASSNMRGEAL